MKSILYSIILIAMLTLSVSCSKNNDLALPQKDWNGTSSYFEPTDPKGFETYYKPYVGYVGDPITYYDSVAKDFKIMYLQEISPNQVGTCHPIWRLSTKDAAKYKPLRQLISCGGLAEQDATIGTGNVVYNPTNKFYYTFYTGNKYKPASSDNRQVVMVTTSNNFVNWTKNRTFFLKGDTEGYSKNDFRNPLSLMVMTQNITWSYRQSEMEKVYWLNIHILI